VKINQPSTAEDRELDSKEWNFREEEVPKPEVEACFIYEYARELTKRTPRILALFDRWLTGRRAGEKTPQFSAGLTAYKKFRKIMTACFSDFPLINEGWFPDTPWQGLDEDVRSRLVKEVNSGPDHYWHSLPRHKLCIELFKFKKPNAEMAFGEWQYVAEPFRDDDIGQIERGTFAINWNYTDAQLRQAFAEWLFEQRKQREERGLTATKYKPKGRGSFRDQLNWLAGLRVINAYRKEHLVDHTGRCLMAAVPRPYTNYPELREGADKARVVLSSLRRHASVSI
jgi:hypothetical protein